MCFFSGKRKGIRGTPIRKGENHHPNSSILGYFWESFWAFLQFSAETGYGKEMALVGSALTFSPSSPAQNKKTKWLDSDVFFRPVDPQTLGKSDLRIFFLLGVSNQPPTFAKMAKMPGSRGVPTAKPSPRAWIFEVWSLFAEVKSASTFEKACWIWAECLEAKSVRQITRPVTPKLYIAVVLV